MSHRVEHLRRNRELTHYELLNELNVKPLAFVCALFAQFPDAVVRSTRPLVLVLITSELPLRLT
jgi:hypothetical protein